MPDLLADNLVIAMPRGMSLADWKRVGLLDREWRLYESVGASFGTVCLVLTGNRADPELETLLTATAQGRFRVCFVANSAKEPLEQFVRSIPARVAAALGPAGTTIVKTEQLTTGPIAVEIRDHLRAQGHRALLMTRGGYLWSRFAAHEFGPDSPEAESAGAAERVLCRAADLLVGTTEEMVRDLCWRYQVDARRTAVIPNFSSPPEQVHTSDEREKGLIVTAGALVARKRINILIEAVARLDEELKSTVTLEVIGSGPEEAALRALAESRGARVRFTPPLGHTDLLEKLGRCVIYAQASELEGHPKAVLDAMASGAVVVLADSPGLSTLIRTGSTGVLVPSADPADFANAFTGLLCDTDWCDLLGGAAARYAAQTFGLELVARAELDAYRRLLSGEPAARRAA